MQFQKLTWKQKAIRSWRLRRNHLVCRLIEEQHLTSTAALREANRIMNAKKRHRKNDIANRKAPRSVVTEKRSEDSAATDR